VRKNKIDLPLLNTLYKAPTAKSGRPAVIAAVIFSPLLLALLRKEGFLRDDIEWLTLSLAVGDGFDVGAIWKAIGAAESADQVKSVKERIEWWKKQLWVRALGLGTLFDPMVLVDKDAEVHMAYRVPGARIDSILQTLERMRGLKRD
jgi:hypothetical protein